MDAPLTASSAPGPLSGKTFVLTGTLTTMSREDATAAIESMCDRLLANPVIERYRFDVREVSTDSSARGEVTR